MVYGSITMLGVGTRVIACASELYALLPCNKSNTELDDRVFVSFGEKCQPLD